jgi:hypothetical protein
MKYSNSTIVLPCLLAAAELTTAAPLGKAAKAAVGIRRGLRKPVKLRRK